MPTSQSRSSPAMDGRAVLQPACNRRPVVSSRVLKKLPPSPTSPKLRSPATKRLGSEANGLTSSSDRIHLPTPAPTKAPTYTLERKKSKKLSSSSCEMIRSQLPLPAVAAGMSLSPETSCSAPGSIAAGRREQVALQCAQRKMKIAHYGRSKSAKYKSVSKTPSSLQITTSALDANLNINLEEKRCTFITPNSDPLYVGYHDEEWGVPVRDDKKLFELLVLSGAQVGSDWTSILKKRRLFRNAFCEFEAELVASFTEKQITSISTDYGIDIARTRGVVDNANRILEVKKEMGSFEKYVWRFVNNKAISPQYKLSNKIPVKTSKSESISKDMQRRGFRFVGPTVVHSFMQAAGLTNDHLLTCYRHLQCTARDRSPSQLAN